MGTERVQKGCPKRTVSRMQEGAGRKAHSVSVQ
jgi:hypothetical protein